MKCKWDKGTPIGIGVTKTGNKPEERAEWRNGNLIEN